MAAVAIHEKFSLEVGALFLTCFSGNSGAKFLKAVKSAFQRRQILSSFEEDYDSER